MMSSSNRRSVQGFTLIELMIVVVILAIFAAIAIPSYREYARRAIASNAEQAIFNLSMNLSKHKTRNFSYKDFVSTPDPMVLPLGSTGTAVKYQITVRDGNDTSKSLTDSSVMGRNWVIRAESKDPKNYTFLINSLGLKCRNKTAANVTYTDCGTGQESW